MNKIGVLITNLGTPVAPTPKAVRLYLREFLSDTRVVNLPKWLWKIILNIAILPIRPQKSAKAYQKIWTKQGSPLLTITQAQTQKINHYLQAHHQGEIVVDFAMRYGSPSLKSVIDKFEKLGIDKLIILPLYPQYSATTTASTFDKISQIYQQKRVIPSLHFIAHYHQNPAYINALADSVQTFWHTNSRAEKLIMSFHSLPQAHINAGDIYQTHCQTTAKLLATALDLSDDEWLLTFQSRLGKAKWTQPYTDKTLQKFAKDGITSVQVICPGFSADCLETLEEIIIENRDKFLSAGGKKYDYISCLNTQDKHIKMLGGLVLDCV